jgi:hypothetical protein
MESVHELSSLRKLGLEVLTLAHPGRKLEEARSEVRTLMNLLKEYVRRELKHPESNVRFRP